MEETEEDLTLKILTGEEIPKITTQTKAKAVIIVENQATMPEIVVLLRKMKGEFALLLEMNPVPSIMLTTILIMKAKMNTISNMMMRLRFMSQAPGQEGLSNLILI